MIKALLFIWQLPQNLVALLLILWHKITRSHLEKKEDRDIVWWCGKRVADCGVSLGDFIFMDSDRMVYLEDIEHEHGHQFQSKVLGPLYLIIIGIPSAMGNIINRIDYKIHKKSGGWYYKQPWEAWADKAGGVDRTKPFHRIYTPSLR